MSIQWITYKGKRILHCDYRGMKGTALLEELKSEIALLQQAPGKILILDDYTDAVADIAVINYLTSVGKEAEMKTEKAALVGISGLKQWLLVSYNRLSGAEDHQRVFSDVDEAKEWLAE